MTVAEPKIIFLLLFLIFSIFTVKVVSAAGNWVKCSVQLSGKTVVITGANTGIGYETAKDLSKRGANVIMACRNMEKAKEAKAKVCAFTFACYFTT